MLFPFFTMVIDNGQLSLLGLLQEMICPLERDSLCSRDKILDRCHHLPENGLVRIVLALEEVNVARGDDSGQFT